MQRVRCSAAWRQLREQEQDPMRMPESPHERLDRLCFDRSTRAAAFGESGPGLRALVHGILAAGRDSARKLGLTDCLARLVVSRWSSVPVRHGCGGVLGQVIEIFPKSTLWIRLPLEVCTRTGTVHGS
jgi:hypothetical protein